MNFQNFFSDSESARQAESESRRKKRKRKRNKEIDLRLNTLRGPYFMSILFIFNCVRKSINYK